MAMQSFFFFLMNVFINTNRHSRNNNDLNYYLTRKVCYLLKHSGLVDFLSGNVTHLQDTQGKGFEGWLLNQVRVMNV